MLSNLQAADTLLVVLEDHRRRIDEFQIVVNEKLPDLNITFFTTAPAFISWFEKNGDRAAILSLDHDLDEGNPPNSLHQSGSEVVEYLINQSLRMPTIVHSANQFDGDRMKFNLKDSGFKVRRVTPFDDLEWISWRWLPKLRGLLKKYCGRKQESSDGDTPSPNGVTSDR